MPGPATPRHTVLGALVALVGCLALLAGCGDDGTTPSGPAATPGEGPVLGMPSRELSVEEQALVGVWQLETVDAEGQPGFSVRLELMDGGAQRFTLRNPPGEPRGTTHTNEGVWWLEGVDGLLLSPRRSDGRDLAAGSVPETVLQITETGLRLREAATNQRLTRREP